MKKIRTLIVDDEELARKNLAFLLADYCPTVEVIGMEANAKEAQAFIDKEAIDLLFLDIEMPNGSGFDLLESIKHDIDFKIIFITAYHEYALRAFKYSAVDYILKPINPEELTAAVIDAVSSDGGILNDLLVLTESSSSSSQSSRSEILITAALPPVLLLLLLLFDTTIFLVIG